MMDDLRLPAVAARLVAWHNRHPLARRISVAHVHAVGYVGLPFVGAAAAPLPASASAAQAEAPPAAEGAGHEAGSLRERALARARQGGAPAPGAVPVLDSALSEAPLPALATLEPDFSDDFIDPLRPRAVARFAAKSGQVLGRAPHDGPVRQIPANGRQPARAPARVYLLTVVIETDTRKSRVLLGAGLNAPVLGQRILSTPRMAGVAALLALALALPAWLLLADDPHPPPGAVPMAAADAASAAALAAASAALTTAPPAAAASTPAEPVVVAGEGAVTPTAASASPVAAVAASSATPPAVASVATVAATAASVSGTAAPPAAAAVAPAPHGAPHVAPHLAPDVARARPTLAGTQAPASLSIRPLISEEAKAAARQARQQATTTPAPAPATARGPASAAAAAPAVAARSTVPPPTAPAAVPSPAPMAAATPGRLPPAAAPPPARAAVEAPVPPRTAAAAVQAPVQVPVQAPAAASRFALSTRALRTRAEAEQVMVAMRSLLHTIGATEVKVEVLPQGDDWRVVGWSFPRRAEADKARALLVSRGMRVEVVDF